jgi:RNA polymerase sigma factor (sigma-70 family)
VDLPPFQLLLDAHSAALHRFCIVHAGPHHGPDVFQEAVLAALRAYPDLRDGSNLRGWLFKIAARKAIDHHRATGRRPIPTEGLPEQGTDLVVGDGDLWAAVAALPDKQRGAIALRFLGDLPYAEIAAALDCSEAAARQNVRAGLASLRVEVTR